MRYNKKLYFKNWKCERQHSAFNFNQNFRSWIEQKNWFDVFVDRNVIVSNTLLLFSWNCLLIKNNHLEDCTQVLLPKRPIAERSGNHRCIRTTFSQLPPLTHFGAEPLGSSLKRRQSRAVIGGNSRDVKHEDWCLLKIFYLRKTKIEFISILTISTISFSERRLKFSSSISPLPDGLKLWRTSRGSRGSNTR